MKTNNLRTVKYLVDYAGKKEGEEALLGSLLASRLVHEGVAVYADEAMQQRHNAATVGKTEEAPAEEAPAEEAPAAKAKNKRK